MTRGIVILTLFSVYLRSIIFPLLSFFFSIATFKESQTLKVLISALQLFPPAHILQPVSSYFLCQSLRCECFSQFHHLFIYLSISLSYDMKQYDKNPFAPSPFFLPLSRCNSPMREKIQFWFNLSSASLYNVGHTLHTPPIAQAPFSDLLFPP